MKKELINKLIEIINLSQEGIIKGGSFLIKEVPLLLNQLYYYILIEKIILLVFCIGLIKLIFVIKKRAISFFKEIYPYEK